jgi:hypothetical protein
MSKRHPHRYRRTFTTFGRVWSCTLPDCNHYMPRHMESLIPGKRAQCNECENTYILTHNKMAADEPICDECEVEHRMRHEELAKGLDKTQAEYLEQLTKELKPQLTKELKP